jgi:DNA-binding FrmR family transcriptional regulator
MRAATVTDPPDTRPLAAASAADLSPASRPRQGHLTRLRRIEGQIRGLARMVEGDQYCIDVLTQVSATTRALQAFSLELLEDHLASCVRDAVQHGGTEADAKIAEASAAVARLVRS